MTEGLYFKFNKILHSLISQSYIGVYMPRTKVIPFHYLNKTKEEFRDYLNNKYPIGIKQFENIIHRIHSRYPILDKSEISIIVKTLVESIRDFIVMGCIINIMELRCMKLKLFKSKVAKTKLKFHRPSVRVLIKNLKVLKNPPKKERL